MDTPDEHRERWERWFARAGAPGFKVLDWKDSDGRYEIRLEKVSELGKEIVIYVWEKEG